MMAIAIANALMEGCGVCFRRCNGVMSSMFSYGLGIPDAAFILGNEKSVQRALLGIRFWFDPPNTGREKDSQMVSGFTPRCRSYRS